MAIEDKSRILIVDDDPFARDTLAMVLGGMGHELLFASSGSEALELAAAHHPDLVLLDVMMPGMDGFEVCQSLRSHPALAEVSVVITTALDDRASRLKGIQAGADDFLTKPLDRAEIRARVETIFRLNRYRKLVVQQEALTKSHAELERAYDETLEGWVRVLDLRDNETDQHSQRVTQLTVLLARRAGMGESELVHVRRSALLHDIGKIGVPDYILHKSGPLTESEWVVMRRHPQLAYDLLAPIKYLTPALGIPYCHHERWDGSGYPNGLVGQTIPFIARLFAPVDVWDALTSDRPYRKAWPREKALDYIRSQSGSHFDPEAVRLFVEEITK